MTASKKKKRKRQAAGTAFWKPDPANAMFVTCSACGFRVETMRAVETGWTSTEHTALRYHFCPSCGRRMVLRGQPDSAT